MFPPGYRKLLIAVIVTSALLSWTGVAAQEQPESNERKQEKAEQARPEVGEEPPFTVNLETVVVTATRQEEEVFNTSLPVNVINRQQIQREMPISMADLFKREPGVAVSTTGPGSVRPIIRGLYDDRVLTLVDGVRLSEQRGGGNHRLSIDPEQIQRVEIVRGPGSVLYGSDALGGVINIITRQARYETRPDWRYNLSTGFGVNSANDGLEQTATMKGGYHNVNLLLDNVYRNTGNIRTPSGDLPHSFYRGFTVIGSGNLTWPESDLALSAWGTQADIGIPNRTAKESYFKDEVHVMAQGTYRRYDISEIFPEFKIDAAFQRHQRHMHILNPVNAAQDVDLEIYLDINTWNFQPQATFAWGERHNLITGLTFFREDACSRRDRWLINTLTQARWARPLAGVIPDSERTGLGVYAQDEIKLLDHLCLTPGVRFDWIQSACDNLAGHPVRANTQDDEAFTGNLGWLYHLTAHLNLVANVGTAFRAPTLLERYFFGPHQDTVDIGNPDLKPETSFNLDLGLKAKYSHFQGTLNLFRNQIFDYIVKRRSGRFDPASGLEITHWQNIGRALLYGLEAEAEVEVGGGFALYCNLSYVRGKNETDSTDLPDIPPFRSNYGVRYHKGLQPDWELWTDFAGMSVARQGKVDLRERPTGGYTTLTWSAGAVYRKKLRLSLMVDNLTDKSYHDHLSWVTWMNEQPGRNVRFNLNFIF